MGLDGLVYVVVAGRSVQLLEVAMAERRVGAEQQRRLEREGFPLEVTRAGKHFWKEPGTETACRATMRSSS